jgi:hypothetical protein
LRQEKLGKGGSDALSITETIRSNPVGNQSHPVEPSQQPEASLACSGGVTHTTKRRQLTLKPGHRAPKFTSSRIALTLILAGGRADIPFKARYVGPAGVQDPGVGVPGLPRNLGDPAAPSRQRWVWELPNPKLQAPGSASDPEGETNTGARDGTANRRTTKGGRTVRRESERLIVPRKRGNPPHGDPAEERGRRIGYCWRET